MSRGRPQLTIGLTLTLFFSVPGYAQLDSFLKPDFPLFSLDTLFRYPQLLKAAADTIGNFYAVWRHVTADYYAWHSNVKGSRIRHDGTLEEGFIWLGENDTARFDMSYIDVSPGGDLIALEYTSRHFKPLDPSHLCDTCQYNFLRLMDSAGSPIMSDLWVDSAAWTIYSWARGVEIFTPNILTEWVTYFEDGGEPAAYLQCWDASGHRSGQSPQLVNECSDLNCLGSQGGHAKLMDGNAGRLVVVWDEYVNQQGLSSERPVFRIYDSLGLPLTPVRLAGYQPGYVGDCEWTGVPGYMVGWRPDVAVADDGEFLIVWGSCDSLAFDWGSKPWGQIFYADGTPKTGLLMFADAPPHDAWPIRVTWGEGYYYVFWTDSRFGCPDLSCWPQNQDLFVQQVTPDGEMIGHNYLINDVLMTCGIGEWTDLKISKGRACIVWLDIRDIAYPYQARSVVYGQVVSTDLIGTYIQGDMDINYRLTVSDIIGLVNYIFRSGRPPLPDPSYGDLNGDCRVTASDIIYDVSYVFRGGSAYLPPCSVARVHEGQVSLQAKNSKMSVSFQNENSRVTTPRKLTAEKSPK